MYSLYYTKIQPCLSAKKTIKQQIEKFKKSFFQSPNLPFSNFLADDDITNIIEHTPHKRNSVFTGCRSICEI